MTLALLLRNWPASTASTAQVSIRTVPPNDAVENEVDHPSDTDRNGPSVPACALLTSGRPLESKDYQALADRFIKAYGLDKQDRRSRAMTAFLQMQWIELLRHAHVGGCRTPARHPPLVSRSCCAATRCRGPWRQGPPRGLPVWTDGRRR